MSKAFLKKIILSFFVFLVLSFSFVPAAYAQATNSGPTGPWYNQSFKEWFTKVNDSPENEIFGERYTAAQVQWVIYGLFYFIINGGSGNNEVLSCLTKNAIADCADSISNLLSFTPTNNQPPQSIASFLLKDRPLSGITYVKQTARNLHLIPPAQAQTARAGFGFQVLDPVLELWRSSRNVAYILFVIIIVALAFMIMFRVKISPQVVITVQSALPKIAIALILITFSYAIAGFLVDLMYVFIGLISVVLAGSRALITDSPSVMFNFLTQGAITIGGASIPLGIFGLLMVYAVAFTIVLFMVFFVGNGLIGNFLSLAGNTVLATTGIYGLLAILASIVLFIVFLIAGFKIIWMLIKTLANILLLTIFAPFQIAFGVITSASGFGSWVKSFIGNLAVFPVAGLLMALSWIFLIYALKFMVGNAFNFPGTWGELFNQIPRMAIYNGWPPLLGAGNQMTALIFVGTSLSIMMILPKVVELVQGFMTGKPLAYGAAIGEALGPVGAAWGATGGKAVSMAGGIIGPELTYRAFSRLPSRIKASDYGQAVEGALRKNTGRALIDPPRPGKT
jgi:hypothetical protein